MNGHSCNSFCHSCFSVSVNGGAVADLRATVEIIVAPSCLTGKDVPLRAPLVGMPDIVLVSFPID